MPPHARRSGPAIRIHWHASLIAWPRLPRQAQYDEMRSRTGRQGDAPPRATSGAPAFNGSNHSRRITAYGAGLRDGPPIGPHWRPPKSGSRLALGLSVIVAI